MVRALVEADDIQPNDAFFVLTNLGAIMMVRFECVCLGVTVNDRMGMIEVGFVQMLLRND